MKIVFASVIFCLLSMAASAQLNTDTTQQIKPKTPVYQTKASRAHDHLHPKFANIANPSGPGYEIDGAVFRSEAIINRHPTSINDLIR